MFPLEITVRSESLLQAGASPNTREFPGSAHVRDVGLSSADDLAVWEYAKEFGFTIVSKDADFSQRSFLFGFPPKVIWLKLGNCPTRRIEEALKHYCTEILQFAADLQSSFLVIHPH
jgi:predicted nuclease of predicted toxin-antitoxin system